MVQKTFTYIAALLSASYIGWYIYERFTCLQCWGNDIFFAIPSMALVPRAFENIIAVQYLVVFVNAALLFLIVYLLGTLCNFLVATLKK